MTQTLICDTECYPNFWSIGFLRLSDGQTLVMEHSEREPLDTARLRAIMLQNEIITYNGMGYDMPMIWLAIQGASNSELKRANDKIIVGGVRYWEAEDALGVSIPRRLNHIDLIEPQPNAFASLKTLQGRLHGRKMQDLPYSPDTPLTQGQMDDVLAYMVNDLDATRNVWEALDEPLALRRALTKEYGVNFMSKSDAQVGEGILRSRVEKLSGERVQRVETPAGTTFQYRVPEYLSYTHPELRTILDRLRTTDFIVRADGKVDLPDWLAKAQPTIGSTTYAMGIGGLHSTEKNRMLCSDDDDVLMDFDVASYYPAIILNSGLYPKALGPHFLDVYRSIRDERVTAKRSAKDATGADRERFSAKEKGLKIALNGCFGKLGSRYSILYAPHLMIAVTLTGQLALLMLIDRAEQAGIPVVSGNTDGVVFKCPRERVDELRAITSTWERDTGFELEDTEYQILCSASVNRYIAVKGDGKPKRKGIGCVSPRVDRDLRTQLMTNPNMEILSNAVVAYLSDGTPLEKSIRASRDIRDFVTVVNVKGGGTWRGGHLGKVVRYYWTVGGEEILYSTPHPTTGNFKKVSKTDGCRPLMDLSDDFPADLDYARYVHEAQELLKDLGVIERPLPAKALRLAKWSAMAWFAVAV